MKKPVVFVALQQFCESSREPLHLMEQAGLDVRLNTLGRRIKREEMPALLKDADAVLAGVEPYDAELLTGLPQLRCISRCGIGTDAIDMTYAKDHGIAVFVTDDEVILPVAEMAVAMILGLARNFPSHIQDMHFKKWKKHTGAMLSEWIVGLVGFGRIGRAVARCLAPFGCQIIVTDPFVKEDSLPPGVRLTDFASLLRLSNVVSLHAAREKVEGPLMGETEFSQMKSGAYLVNTARGYMVDEDALLKALQSKKLAGAALDVYREEPYEGPLMSLPNVICTPHVATLTHSSRAAMELRSTKNIVAFFKSKILAGVLNE